MREEEIRKLIKIVEESNISELEVSRWGRKIRIIKERHATPVETPAPSVQSAAPVRLEKEAPHEPKEEEVPVKEEKKPHVEIKSPMVGTFYRAPAPGAKPFVEVGDQIKPGQTLCIIEAMKLMNEIEAEISGKILDVLVEDAQPVEYNQPLFLVEVDHRANV